MNFASQKYMNPKVLEALARLQPPSPSVVPRDLSQPRVGYLTQNRYKTEPMLVTLKKSIEKPQLVLNLDTSLSRRRKFSQN